MAAVYNPLTHRDLTARGGYRMDTFYEKIRDGEVFLTKKGAFTADASQLEEIKAVINTKARGPKMKIMVRLINVTLSLITLMTSSRHQNLVAREQAQVQQQKIVHSLTSGKYSKLQW